MHIYEGILSGTTTGNGVLLAGASAAAAGTAVGLIRLAGMELELSDILGGRKVDLNTPNCLSHYFRADVLAEAEVHYAAP